MRRMYRILRAPCPYLASMVKEELEKYGLFHVSLYVYSHTKSSHALNQWGNYDVSDSFMPVSGECAEIWIDDPGMIRFAQGVSDTMVMCIE